MQIGIIVNHLASSQLSYMITQQVNNTDKNVVIFQKAPIPPMQRVNTSVFPIYDIVKFKGTLIGLDLDSAKYMVNLATPSRKIYYPWEMEWMVHGNDYLSTVKTIMSPKIEVVAKSESYATQIRLMNREPSAIIPELDLESFERYCNEHTENRRYVNTEDVIPGVLRERKEYNLHSC